MKTTLINGKHTYSWIDASKSNPSRSDLFRVILSDGREVNLNYRANKKSRMWSNKIRKHEVIKWAEIPGWG